MLHRCFPFDRLFNLISMQRILVRKIVTILSLCSASFSFGQGTTATPVTAPIPLTLEECIQRAMRKNFDLQIQGFSSEIAKEALNVASADFDPTFTATTRRNLNQSAATTSRLDGTAASGPRSDNTVFSVGASQRVVTGGTVSVAGNTTRAATNSLNSTLNPAFGSSASVSLSQPLLRGAGSSVARANIDRSKLGVGIALLNYKIRVLTVIRDTENAYYNLAYARENLMVKRRSLELAVKLFEENKVRKSTGVATDLDVLTAEVGVANSRRAVVQAEQAVSDREDSLSTLTGEFGFNSRPGEVKFGDYTEGAPSFDLVYKSARDRSPDFLVTQAQIKQIEIDARTAKQAALPGLNLDTGVGYTATERSYGDAIGSLPDGNGYNWNVGLSVSVPWGLHADKARLRTAKISLLQQQTRLQQLDQTLLVNVRSSVRAVETNIVAVEIAGKATELSQKQYDLQKARFDAGLSTSRLVLQAQDDLEAARVNELQSKVSLRVALAELNRIDGSSLERYRIALPE
ncbi:MAG: TolC family protein [Verrucomicrobia bacterium]|nr:TolC family protein [Verrucomicrobiota bacterium]